MNLDKMPFEIAHSLFKNMDKLAVLGIVGFNVPLDTL